MDLVSLICWYLLIALFQLLYLQALGVGVLGVCARTFAQVKALAALAHSMQGHSEKTARDLKYLQFSRNYKGLDG